MTTLFAIRRATLALLLVCAAPSFAAPNVPGQQAQRQQISALKKATFERLRDLHAIDLGNQYPARTRVSVYLNLRLKNLELEKLSVRIDGTPVSSHKYTPEELAILKSGITQRLIRVNLAPGKHRLTLAFSGIEHRRILSDKTVRGGVTLEFVKDDSTAKVLLIPLTSDALGTTETLNSKQATLAPGQEDPRLDNARFLRATGHRYSALIELLEMAGASDTSQVLPLAYDIELAQSYVDFGMRDVADQSMRTAFDTGVDLQVLADVWLRIAELDYERGNISRAYTLLQYLKPNLTPAQRVTWQDIMSRLLMSEGQFDQAKDILEHGNNALEVLTAVDLPTNQTPIMRFNYAVILLKQGETAEGRTLLERIGRVTDFNEQQRTLRDKANLLLGYNFLENKQGATAKNILQRIRLNGPYSNEALLALGWSELSPPGTQQERATVGDEPPPGTYGVRNPGEGRIVKPNQPASQSVEPFRRIQMGPFKQAKMADDKDDALRRALVAWKEVASHSSQDAAVQEALIAIPYALSTLGKAKLAANFYTHAITELEDARAELSGYASADTINLDAITRGDLSNLPDAPWMLQLLASYPFQEHYQNYIELRHMHKDMQRLAGFNSQNSSLRLSASAQQLKQERAQQLNNMLVALQTNADEQAKLAQAVVAAEIKRQGILLDKYIISARLGIADFSAQVDDKATKVKAKEE